MCIACSPGFQSAFRSLAWPSRRALLKRAGAVTIGSVFIAEAVGPVTARADGGIGEALAMGLGGDQQAGAAPPVTIFTARKVITMERVAPTASAIAVSGKRILAVGSLDEVKAAVDSRPYTVMKRLPPGLCCRDLSISTSIRYSAH